MRFALRRRPCIHTRRLMLVCTPLGFGAWHLLFYPLFCDLEINTIFVQLSGLLRLKSRVVTPSSRIGSLQRAVTVESVNHPSPIAVANLPKRESLYTHLYIFSSLLSLNPVPKNCAALFKTKPLLGYSTSIKHQRLNARSSVMVSRLVNSN